MTTFTDAILAVECWILAGLLAADPVATGPAAGGWAPVLMAVSLAALGVAAASGAAAHGLVDHLSARVHTWAWRLSLAAIGLAGAGMLAAVVRASVAPPWQMWLVVLVAVKLVAFWLRLRRDDSFRTAVVDYGIAMVAVVALQVWARWQGPAPAAAWIVGAVALSGAGSAVQQAKLGLGPRFNHNDVYHVIQMVALYLFYRGGSLLTDA